jgi:transposase
VAVASEMTRQIAALEAELAQDFDAHPDAWIVRSLPGLGTVLGARVLGEFGDDPNRYADAKARRNYAGTSPVTRASGKKRAVWARFVRNRHLADAAAGRPTVGGRRMISIPPEMELVPHPGGP